MTPEQHRLARHALGLVDGKRKSFRNRFFTGKGSPAHADWSNLVSRGFAVLVEEGAHNDRFALTMKGAQAVLKPRESLDLEDFEGLPS